MKSKTVEQFKIIKYLEENFIIDSITLKLIDRFTIEVTDDKGEKMNFKYQDNKVIYEEV